jgi:hypothetical protein
MSSGVGFGICTGARLSVASYDGRVLAGRRITDAG